MTISVPSTMGISGEGTESAVFPALTLAVGCLLPQQLLEPFPFTPNLHAVNLQLPVFLLQLFHIFQQRDFFNKTKLCDQITRGHCNVSKLPKPLWLQKNCRELL